MADNALCDYCDAATGGINPSKGGEYKGIFADLWNMVSSLVSSLFDMLFDLAVYVFCGVLEGFLYVANLLHFPTLVNSLQGMVNGLDPVIGYLLYRSGFTEGLVILGGGFSFYVLRKLVTLGNW